ncbi:MAG: hypothetical protein JSW34_07965 [Candidatus Zixiibacteriota bacterium]|nr:MAG: hypothetical protein JSW34_07965 [candidate division Zixibacteria bacterium]
MFISGGENIHPEEIEQVIGLMDGVEEVVVVAVDDAEFGQRPVAFVKLAPSNGMKLENLPAALGEHLPRFKIPVRIFDWPDNIPAVGLKPDRRFLKELAVKKSTDG